MNAAYLWTISSAVTTITLIHKSNQMGVPCDGDVSIKICLPQSVVVMRYCSVPWCIFDHRHGRIKLLRTPGEKM